MVFPRGNPNDSRSRTGRTGAGSMWDMHPMHHRLSDGCDHGAASTRRAPLHFLPNNRAQNFYSAGIAAAYRRSHLWMRCLSGSLSVESFRADFTRVGICRKIDNGICAARRIRNFAISFAIRRSNASNAAAFCATFASRSGMWAMPRICPRSKSRRAIRNR